LIAANGRLAAVLEFNVRQPALQPGYKYEDEVSNKNSDR
jgi:hypothetical protein